MPNPSIRIGARPLLEYIANTARRNRIIKDQIRNYTDPSSQAHVYYGPMITAIKNAVNAADPEAVLAKCVQRASSERGQRAAFQAIADGFTTWYRATSGTGVRVPFTTWTHGELTVTLRDVFGLRLRSGRMMAVLPYVGSHQLQQADADVMLRIIEQSIDQLLPGTQPVVLDTRRGKKFTLHGRKNRRDLDDAITGEVARYVTHWQAAAA